MTKLALRMLRNRPGSAVATLIALAAGFMILMTMGVLVESGLRFQPQPQRYADVDVVIARTELTITGKDIGGDTTRTTVRLPESAALPADLVAGVRRLPGVAKTVVFPDTGAGVDAGRVEAVGVVAAPGADRAALTAQLGQLANTAGAKAYAGTDRGKAEQSAGLTASSLLVTVGASFGGYVVLLIVFVVAGTVGLSVRHRRRDLALLRAIAATPGQVRRLLMMESVLLSAAAAVIGGPAGLVATRWVSGQLTDRGFIPAGFPIVAGALAAPAALIVTTLVAVLSALIAARRATAIRPTEALGEAATEPAHGGKVRLGFGLAALAGAVSSSIATVGLGGQAALAGALGMLYLFVGAVALLAPWINGFGARLLAPVLRRVWGAGGYLATANLRANARGMATVLAALVLSVGFGGSVWFLQNNLERQTVAQTKDGMLAQRELVSPAGLSNTTVDEIRRLPGVQAVTGVRRTSVIVKVFEDAEVVAAQAIDPHDATATMDPQVSSGSLAGLDDRSMAVSAMRASTEGWKVGDQASLWLGDGTPVKLRVAAIYDRALGFGDVILNSATLSPRLNDEVLIRTAPGADVDAGLAKIAARHRGAAVVDTGNVTAQLASDLAISAWLNKLLIGVMVGYAALAAANTMIMAAFARTRELALLRLAGTTRRQIKRMINAEQTGLLGVALVIGASIAAITLAAVVNALTGSPVPYVPPLGWVAVIGGATLLALTTTVVPIALLLRSPPIKHIGLKE